MLDREGRVSIHISIAVFVGSPRGGHEPVRLFKLGQESINRSIPAHVASFGWPSTSGRRARISAIEIIGKNRTNTNNKLRNKPMEPNRVAQSQKVGEYMPQED